MKCRVAWDVIDEAHLEELRVYVSQDRDTKGELVATQRPNDRFATIDLDEGTWFIRVVPVSKGGGERGWQTGKVVEHTVTRQRVAPSAALSNVTVQRVDAANQAAVVADPPASDEAATEVEVIAGPDAERGQLVARVPLPNGGVTGRDADRVAVVVPGLDGGRGEGNDQSLVVRPLLTEGRTPGTSEALTVPFLDRANHRATEIASIVGATLSNVSSPASTDPWEADATDGVRLRAIPAINALDGNGWGTLGTGLLADQPIGAYYCTEAVVASGEHDFGETIVFSLEMYDEAQRKTSTGYFSSLPLRRLQNRPFSPADIEDIDDSQLGPEWWWRVMTLEGKPTRPLPITFKAFRAGDSTPLSGDWTPYVPGARIRARYVQVRWTFREAVGMHQLISPRVYARAWVSLERTAAHVKTKDGSDFTTGELADVTDTSEPGFDLGIRVDSGGESLQVNIDGTIRQVALA